MSVDYTTEAAYREKLGMFCGVDEAGRGPLAGDVFAAAVILPAGAEYKWLDDSKKVTPKRRDILFDEIKATAVYCIARATVAEIDEYNILQASLLAMRRAIDGLPVKPDAALIDGNIDRGFQIKAAALIGGDALVPSIAAASILAKVSRDRYCTELDALYPGYNFAKHKGYGTREHIEALQKLGASPAHRKLFISKIIK